MPTDASTQSAVSATIAPSAPVLPAAPVKTRALQAKPKPEATLKVPAQAATNRGSKPAAKKAASATTSAPIPSKTGVNTPPKPTINKQVAKVAEKSASVEKSTPVADKTPVLKQKKAKGAKGKAAHRAPIIKMVRDSFTFPESEHKRLVELKKRLIALGTEVKKGELVRAAIGMLFALDNEKLIAAVADVEKLKTGRPKK